MPFDFLKRKKPADASPGAAASVPVEHGIQFEGLTEEWRVPTPNANRFSEVVADANFGFIDIDWRGPATKLTLGIVDATGRTRLSFDIELASLAA